MTLTDIATTAADPVAVTSSSLVLRNLIVEHREAVEIVRRHLDQDGPQATADLVRRAVPVGLVALTMGEAAVDTGALGRTLDGFAGNLDAAANEAITRLRASLEQLQAGERAVEQTARQVLDRLPTQVEAALAGEAGNVRAAVVDAARTIQAAGLQELTAVLGEHGRAMRSLVTLDEGPIRALRQELMNELTVTRQELAGQLTQINAAVRADEARQQASAKSSRAVGAAWEAEALAMAEQVVVAAGDRWETTGNTPGVGTTRRTGDGVAHVTTAMTGPGHEVRICLEAKKRTRKLAAAEARREIRDGRQVRQAAAGIILVPTPDEVPGSGGASLCRVDDFGFVVAASEPQVVSLVYLIVRELVVLLTVRQSADSEIDLTQVEARVRLALAAIEEFSEVGKLASQAKRSLDRLLEVGQQAQAKARQALTDSLQLLHN